MQIETKLDLSVILNSPNLCAKLSERDVEEIGHVCMQDFTLDKQSRTDWEAKTKEALRLALQVTEKKTFPWPDASNVKFPLLTTAALQFHSRAYPALIGGPTPVACRALQTYPELQPVPQQQPQQQGGQPPGGQQGGQQPDPKLQQEIQRITQQNQSMMAAYTKEKKRAQRVADHMSYQILEEDVNWEEEMDKLLLIMAILGCAFKKTYFDPVSGHNVSECVSPEHLVIHYYTKNIDTSPRYSHLIYLSRNTIVERQRRGVFQPFSDGSPDPVIHYRQGEVSDEREGTQPLPQDSDNPFELIEQYRWIDLDGDGYAEPYIVTVRVDTKQVLRIVARFTSGDIETSDGGQIIRITPFGIFTKYSFIPSPDGGFYDLGFGCLLGPINASIDTAINQLIDAGSLSTAGGGFLGRGFKAKKGDLRFRLGEWKQVDCTGDDMRKSIFPLPASEPSPVLFQLLTLMIEYGQQVAGAADILQGKNPGQNTPAETSRTMVEQGMKVFNGIYKRVHRGFTQELRHLFHLNKVYLSTSSVFFSGTSKEAVRVFQADYSDKGTQVLPSADPFYMSDAQRMQMAMGVLEAAGKFPGYNLYVANVRYLQALKVQDIDEVLPDPKGPNAVPPKLDPRIQVEQMKQEVAKAKLQLDAKRMQMELSQEAAESQMQIKKMAAEIIGILAEAKGVEAGHQIAQMEMMIGLHKAKLESTLKAMEIMQRHSEAQHDQSES